MLDYESSDIDFFCFINGCPIHFASNGGELPRNLYTQENLINILAAVQASETFFDWEINREFVALRNENYNYINEIEESDRDSFLLPDKEISNINDYKRLSSKEIAYSWSFIEMARRGFFSFDRVEGNNYRLVAYPTVFPYRYKHLKNAFDPSKKSFHFVYGRRCHYYYALHHYTNHKLLSMTRHLFTGYRSFSFRLGETINLIDVINSIINN